MGELTVASSLVGEVLVSEELIDVLGDEAIDIAVGQLRLSGGKCWSCGLKIHHVEDVSLVVNETAVGGHVGFIHLRCGPPQIHNSRRNRRAAHAFDRYMRDRSSDAQAFTVVRNYPHPHGVLVISLQAPITTKAENGDVVNPWFNMALEAGMIPLAPDVFDADPEPAEGWSLQVVGDDVVCDSPIGRLYVGGANARACWLEAVAGEGLCLAVAVGLGVSSHDLGAGCAPALNLLASKGLVAGATVRIIGSLGINTALAKAYGEELLSAR